MSDWRGDNSSGKPSKPSRREPAKPKEKKPKASKPAGGGGWRGKGTTGASTAGTPEAEKSWQGGYAETAPVTASTVGRWLAIMLLSAIAIGSTGFFVWWVFYRATPLPLYLVSVGDCASAELVENPFGNDERKSLQSVNNVNIKYKVDETRGNDNSLSKLQFEEWFPKHETWPAKGGGPSRKFVVFYINSFAVEKDGTLTLVPQSGQPWLAGTETGAATVDMKLMLQNIAKSLDRGAVGWVVLDLHAPPGGLTPEGSDRHWASLTRTAWDGLDEKDQNRLVITLPCSDGEANWLAPEYKSTFFGYFLKRALAGGFNEKQKWIETTTLSAMQEVLNARITSAVASRRYAKQTPVWIVPDAVSESMQVVSRTKSRDFEPTPPSGLDSRLTQLADLWKSLEQEHKNAWRWDPAGTAIAESSLILAEQLATWGSEGSFLKATSAAQQAIDRIQVPMRPPAVSLVENELYEEFAISQAKQGRKYAALDNLALSTALPSFWEETKPADGSLPPRGPEQDLSENDRAAYYWKWLVNRARLADRGERTRTFEEPRISRGLEFCKEGKDWLEIYFVRLIQKEVDWELDGESNSREDAIALAVSVFDRLQSIAGNPVPELSWWIEKPFMELEGRFLMALDKLLAGSFTESAADLGRIDADFQALVSRSAILEEALSTRDLASRVIPDLIAWNIRHFQYCDDNLVDEKQAGAIQNRLKALARMMEQTGVLSNELAREPKLESLSSGGWDDLKKSLQSELEAFQKFVDDQKDQDKNPKNNPKTYRNVWIALQSPLTTSTDRQLLHAIVHEFLEKGASLTELGADASANLPPHRKLDDATDVLLTALQSPTDDDLWKGIVSGKMRFSIGDSISNMVGAEPAAGEAIQNWRNRLLQNDMAVRFRSGPLADASTFRKSIDMEHWPWSVGSQRWKLDTANYRLFQTNRLAQAAWGSLENGNLDFVQNSESCYFGQLAAKYRPEDAISKSSPVDRLTNEFSRLWDGTVSAGVEHLKALKVEFGSEGEGIDSNANEYTTNVEVFPHSWNAIPEVSLVHLSRDLPLVLPSRESKLLLPVDLSGEQKVLRGISVDLAPWKDSGGQKPDRKISLRGNWRSSMVDWKIVSRDRIDYDLAFRNEPFAETVIVVNPPENPPVINVVLLVDCSDSMDLMIPPPLQEGAGGGNLADVQLFTLVQERAINIVEKLDQIQSEKFAVVNLSLMPFGLLQPEEGGIQFRKLEEQIYRTELKPLDSRWKAEVTDAIKKLTPGGETPLYDSIRLACETLESQQGRRQLVYVLSDGVNYTTPVVVDPKTKVKTGTGLTGSSTDVEKRLESIQNIKLSIFHFDYFQKWISKWKDDKWKEYKTDPRYAAFTDDDFNEKMGKDEKLWNESQTEGIDALNGMNRHKSRFSYRKYTGSQMGAMIKDVEDSIPRMKILIQASKDLPQYDPEARRFVIPQESIPCDVTVTAEFESLDKATQTVWVLGGETLTMTYQPGLQSLQFPDFTDEKQNPEFRSADKSDSAGNKRLFLHPIQNNQGSLEFRFGFGNTPAGRNTFVNRPGFLVAEVDELGTGQNEGKSYFLADHAFLTGKHFPIAKTAELKIDRRSTGTRLRVWYADVEPECVQRIPVDAGTNDQQIQDAVEAALGALGVKNVTVQISRNAKTLACKVEYQGKMDVNQRLFVICRQASSSDRKHDLTRPENNWESHVFSLDGMREDEKPVILLVSPGKLNESLDGNLQHFDSSR